MKSSQTERTLSTDAFDVGIDGAVACLRLTHGPVNSLRFADWVDFRRLISELESDEAVRSIVITGHPGRHFCAGNDTNEFTSLSARAVDDGTAAVLAGVRALYESRLVSVAAIHGAALGSGLLLAAACDIRVSTPDSKLGLPEILAGAFGGYRLAREIFPKGEARLTALTGEPVDGTRAHQLGIVQRLYASPAEAVTASVALATSISDKLTKDLAVQAKYLLNRIETSNMWDGHDLERLLEVRIMASEARHE